MIREILSYLFALLPAVYVAGWGRYLVRHLDDPVFPELHLKKIRRLATALAVGLFLSLLASNELALLKIALVVLGVTIADFPSRRKIFQESWGLFAYLRHGVRFVTAYFGPLILLILMPELVYRAGEWAPQVAAAAALAYLSWSLAGAWAFPRILGAVPLNHPELEARFAEVLAKARCRTPRLWRAGPQGANFVNAFALPSLLRPGVVFSSTLLEALGPRETTATFAHEVGHLEHYHRWRLVRRLLLQALAVGALLFALFYFGLDSPVAANLTWMWPLGNLLLFSRRQARNQTHEHESDRRAVELCDDPRAVADGLLKIHLLTAMPRRWAADNERRMSHPSLAQRLRAIREAGGAETAPEAGPEIAVRAADDPTRGVVLAADRLHWLSGLPAGAELDAESAWRQAGDARAILYFDLADLRLEAGAFGRRRLMATDRQGATMKLPLAPADVAAVKAAVERLDFRVLGTAPQAAPVIAAAAGRGIQRLQGLLTLLLAVWPPFTGPLALAALLVLIRPAVATLAAAGAIGTASAALCWWRPAETWLGSEASVQVTLAARALLGLLFLGQAWRRHRRGLSDPRWATPMALAVLGAFAALSAIGLGFRFALPYPLFQVHRWAHPGPAFLLLLLGIAAALFSWKRWAARLPAVGLAAVAAAGVFAGTETFRERFGGDPLRSQRPRLRLESPALEKVRSVTFDKGTSLLVLSPSGARLAAVTWEAVDWDEVSEVDSEDEDWDDNLHFEVETADGDFARIEGALLEFLDDERVAVLATRGEEMTLSIRSLAVAAARQAVPEPASPEAGETEDPAPDNAGEPEIVLPLLISPKLRLDGARWQVTGTELEQLESAGQSISRFSGVFGEPGLERRSWRLEADEAIYYPALHVGSDGRLLALGNHTGIGDWSYLTIIPFLSGYGGNTEVTTLGPEGQQDLLTTTLPLSCLDPDPGQGGVHCLATDLGTTQLWTFDPEAGRFTPLGSLPGDYWQAQATGDGRLLLSGTNAPLALVDPAAGFASLIGEQIDAGPPFGGDLAEGLEGPGRWFFEAMIRQNSAFLDSSTLAAQPGLLAVAVRSGEKTRVDVYRLLDAAPKVR